MLILQTFPGNMATPHDFTIKILLSSLLLHTTTWLNLALKFSLSVFVIHQLSGLAGSSDPLRYLTYYIFWCAADHLCNRWSLQSCVKSRLLPWIRVYNSVRLEMEGRPFFLFDCFRRFTIIAVTVTTVLFVLLLLVFSYC